jgi:hypothetical protein
VPAASGSSRRARRQPDDSERFEVPTPVKATPMDAGVVSGEPAFDGPAAEMVPGGQLELAQHRVHVALDCLDRDEQVVRDLPAGSRANPCSGRLSQAPRPRADRAVLVAGEMSRSAFPRISGLPSLGASSKVDAGAAAALDHVRCAGQGRCAWHAIAGGRACQGKAGPMMAGPCCEQRRWVDLGGQCK